MCYAAIAKKPIAKSTRTKTRLRLGRLEQPTKLVCTRDWAVRGNAFRALLLSLPWHSVLASHLFYRALSMSPGPSFWNPYSPDRRMSRIVSSQSSHICFREIHHSLYQHEQLCLYLLDGMKLCVPLSKMWAPLRCA